MVFVFLVLAAQYESWKLPLAVILVVPMCLLCSIVGVDLAGMDVNIFTQIGFVVLVGLASKNAILIVEFAKQQQEAGEPRARGDAGGLPAAAAADPDDLVRLHLRRGARWSSPGAPGRDAPRPGTGRVRGMLGVTLFGIFLTPVFFYVIQWFRPPSRPRPRAGRGDGDIGAPGLTRPRHREEAAGSAPSACLGESGSRQK